MKNSFKKTKYILVGIIIGILISGSTFAANKLIINNNPFPIKVDGEITKDIIGYNINNSTFLKLRDFQKLGIDITFNKQDNIIEINTNSTTTIPTKNPTVTPTNTPTNTSNINIPVISPTKYNSKDYINIEEFNDRYKNCYSLKISTETIKNMTIDTKIYYFNLYNNDKNIILENIPATKSHQIEYSYYINNILPLVSQK